MNKFYKSACSYFRNQMNRSQRSNFSNAIPYVFNTARSNLSYFSNLFKSNGQKTCFAKRYFSSNSSNGRSLPTKTGLSLAFISFFPRKSKSEMYQNAFEVEKAISELVSKAEQMVVADKFADARAVLYDALKLAEATNVYSNVSSVYDLLSTIAFKEGGITEAEDMLVKFIEKLIQLGYPENHNSIVRFKLKLSRLYQSVGNRDMAELGFRDCINTQEEKIVKRKVNDEMTHLIYVSSLFWYGRFLTEHGEFQKAKTSLKKALNTLDQTKSVSPAQVMVVLYYNAEVAYLLKEYDDSLNYLYQAINVCKESDPENRDLPLYLVKVGYIHIVKGLYSEAKFWCLTAEKMARLSKNQDAKAEADLCVQTIEKVVKNPQLRGKT